MPTPARKQVFVCYSHLDERWLIQLQRMMGPLAKDHDVSIWSDKEIQSGDKWKVKIEEALSKSQVALLLVSTNFFSSKFIAEVELPTILDKRMSEGMVVLWVPVGESTWEATEISHYEAVLNPAEPLESQISRKRPAALKQVAESVVKAFLRAGKGTLSEPQVFEPNQESEKKNNTTPTLPVRVNYRNLSETEGEDNLLAQATEARFVGLTFKTLGLAFTNGGLSLPELRHVELAVYALPILHEWHPTLRHSNELLKNEWKKGLTDTLMSLLNPNLCPNIEKIDLRIVNRVPTFSSSMLTIQSYGEPAMIHIRYTPVLEGEELATTPTITLSSPQIAFDPVLSAFARIVDNMRVRCKPLTFPIFRRGSSSYQRSDIPTFVRRLSSITNHPGYDLRDTQFVVQLRIDEGFASVAGFKLKQKSRDLEVSPEFVQDCFDWLRDRNRSDSFRIALDFENHLAVIEISESANPQFFEARVTGRHKVGVFALLTKGSVDERSVILKHKGKLPWPFDVPGGKVANIDRTLEDTLSREIFEELGMLIDGESFGDHKAFKYDKHSNKEGVPVIAIYCHHDLTESEMNYLDEFPPPDAEAATWSLAPYSLVDLIKVKMDRRDHWKKDLEDAEAECHAPLEALLDIQRRST